MPASLDSQIKTAEKKKKLARLKLIEQRFLNNYDILRQDKQRKRRKAKIEFGDEEKTVLPANRLKLIAYGRELYRNFSQAKGMIKQLWLNVVHTGAKVQFHTEDEDWNREAGRYFNTTWAKRSDGRGNLHLGDQVRLAFMSLGREGDCLLWYDSTGVIDKGKLFWFEADQLTNIGPADWKNNTPKEYTEKRDKEKKAVPMKQEHGLILDKWGRVQGYVITADHGKTEVKLSEATIIRSDHAVLLMDPFRLNQKRGIAELINVAPDLEDIKEMRQHELQAGKVAATFAMQITSVDADEKAIGRSDRPEQSDLRPVDTTQYDSFEALTGGAIEYMEPGEEAKVLKNERPAQAVQEFFNSVTESAGASMGLPKLYSRLVADSSFSAARAEQNLAKKLYTYYQKFLERYLYDFLVENVISDAILSKIIPARDDWKDNFSFDHPGFEEINPAQETKARKDKLKGGISNLQKELGPKWEDDLDQLAKEKKAAEAKGLTLDIFAPPAGPGG